MGLSCSVSVSLGLLCPSLSGVSQVATPNPSLRISLLGSSSPILSLAYCSLCRFKLSCSPNFSRLDTRMPSFVTALCQQQEENHLFLPKKSHCKNASNKNTIKAFTCPHFFLFKFKYVRFLKSELMYRQTLGKQQSKWRVGLSEVRTEAHR